MNYNKPPTTYAGHITDIRKQAQQLKGKTKEALKKVGEEIEKNLLVT